MTLPRRMHLRRTKLELLLLVLVVFAFRQVVRNRRLAALEDPEEQATEQAEGHVSDAQREEEFQSSRCQQCERSKDEDRRTNGAQASEADARNDRIRALYSSGFSSMVA